ncbi:N-acetyl-beta-D-galactosaminidase [Aureococcus anophagefferens]|nr:N-acetyl-beta-D-galactosaminidase [Aureococcus anophagefferens]
MGDGATPVRSVTIRLNASAAGAPVLEAAAARAARASRRRGRRGHVCYVDVASPSAAAAPQLEDFEGGGEAYALTATAAGAQIVAATVWGALRGLETLFQAVVRDGDAWCVAGTPLVVDDAPRFPWRGLLLDTARRFYPVAAILRQLDAMEASKLNVFHWHLTDAESVPVALAALPAVAAAGAFAPEATYDAAAVATVVAHAAARGIRVVPEFDTPAHAGGFFLSRPDLFCGDTYADAVLDPTREAVYEFLDALYASSAKLFPDDVLHVGGDEVSTKCWNASASVRAWLAARNATVDSLYGYYEARAVAIAARAGRAPMAWDEAFSDLAAAPSVAVVAAEAGVPANAIRGLFFALVTATLASQLSKAGSMLAGLPYRAATLAAAAATLAFALGPSVERAAGANALLTAVFAAAAVAVGGGAARGARRRTALRRRSS